MMRTDEEGKVIYGNFGAKSLSQRGVQYSLPLPKGGRHAVNPIVNPDQRVSYRPPRSRDAPLNALDPDYVGGGSPFVMNDVTSRGVNIAFRNKSGHATPRAPGQRRTNPNASRPRKKK
ncbi:RNA-binding protein NOB1-like [Sycon ciliatum]